MCQFFVLIPTMLRCRLNLEGQEPKKKITKWRLLFVIWLCLVSLTTIAIEAEEQDIESLINALTDESEVVPVQLRYETPLKIMKNITLGKQDGG